ncbi:DUF1801 domain-containing protein [Lysobacter sp. BMK333-48F3]|uniref:DUF1801 domain-containing protein n=1 Tax=Lysobacter sp. BMK333-48F3 TaxID=2867962 RepID=UPI001C8C62E8|nr:DUF1801 domain-containing protein [Lysobacter sp. BMK333-48F3]MBX9403869.1 DUF1801 domain-containing protein [Lysobacter sp. BMK333-48F3]
MASPKPKPAASVDAFVAALAPPLQPEVEALRRTIRSLGPGIGEEIKWNAPSFHAGEHFATLRLNGKVPLQLILHLGAKKSLMPPDAIDDPAGLLQWLGPDRACVSFTRPGEVDAQADALKAILRQWLQHVPART